MGVTRLSPESGARELPESRLWRLFIGENELSPTVVKVVGSLNADGGTSDLRITARTELSRYQNERVELWLKSEQFFTGYLEEPKDGQWGDASKATAWGPFKSLVSQRFLIRDGEEGADYRGDTLAQALLDISNRASPRMTNARIEAGEDFRLEGEGATFALEDTLGEAASKLMESASVVGMDLPGWKRRYIPKPTADGGSPVASYDEGDYPYGGFSVTPADRNVYSHVLIYRRLESGEQAFPPVIMPIEAEGPVQPAPNKVFEVEEFLGGYEQALAEAKRLAANFKKGTYAFELEGIPVDPALYLFERVDITTTEFRGPDRSEEYRCTYRCLIDDTLTVNLSDEEFTMDLAGSAVKVRERRIAPTPRRQRPKSYVLGGPGPPPLYGYLDDGRPYVAEELPYVSYDPDTGEVLIDADLAAAYGISAYYDETDYTLVMEFPEGYDPYVEGP